MKIGFLERQLLLLNVSTSSDPQIVSLHVPLVVIGGCIVVQYIIEEVLELYISYLLDVDFICIPKSRYAKRTFGDEITGKQILSISRT
ncbi:hypothetical protein Lal_00042484 [Lupinus albus]|nr:hypothetical protein Lal_00042484 [Lupinus albus]